MYTLFELSKSINKMTVLCIMFHFFKNHNFIFNYLILIIK